MRQFFSATQDASIYEAFPDKQAGLDEILNVGKSDDGLTSIRSLIQFDIASISASISNRTLPISTTFDMKLFLSNANKLKLKQVVEVYPLSESWVEGSGYFYQDSFSETDGTTWKYRQTGSLWINSGSTFITSPTASAVAAEDVSDFTFDVTNIVQAWLSGTIVENGVVVKFPSNDEMYTGNAGSLAFFSRNTHTVFAPTIIAKWDDSTFSTGSLTAISSSNFTVYPTNLKGSYKQNEMVRIDLTARATYPLKSFDTQFSVWNTSYLPTSSYYSIVDVQSREIIIPFDNYSKVSVDTSGNFINFGIQRMFPNRYYKLMIKVVTNGYQYLFDNNYVFTVGI